MKIKDSIKSQYRASLEMFVQVVENYPEGLWADAGHKNPAWLLAYHALWYTHFYLHKSAADFVPWEKSRPELQQMQPEHAAEAVYTQADILAYARFFQERLDAGVDALDLEGPSGFHWLPMTKFELQFYNIRHLMQHTGELAERLWAEASVETGWVGKG